jgi:hypothetical protein
MKMQVLGSGKILIEGDEALLAKIEGQSLVGVDISDLQVDAQSLSEIYCLACSTRNSHVYNVHSEVVKTHDNIKRYQVLKTEFLKQYGN